MASARIDGTLTSGLGPALDAGLSARTGKEAGAESGAGPSGRDGGARGDGFGDRLDDAGVKFAIDDWSTGWWEEHDDTIAPIDTGPTIAQTAPGYGGTAVGGAGDDTILGNADGPLYDVDEPAPAAYDDVIYGGAGDDWLDGGAGDDLLYGEGDDDFLLGGDGNDSLIGGDGHDQLIVGRGDDVADGGAGHDYINAWGGDNTLRGGGGNDMVLGAQGRDTLEGGTGDDLLDGHLGQDELWGGAGADRFANNHDSQLQTGTFDVVHDYSFEEGDSVEGASYDVATNGHTHVYDANGAVVLVLAGYDAFSLGILLV